VGASSNTNSKIKPGCWLDGKFNENNILFGERSNGYRIDIGKSKGVLSTVATAMLENFALAKKKTNLPKSPNF